MCKQVWDYLIIITDFIILPDKVTYFYKYVFSITKIAQKSFFAYCLKEMPTFMQFTLCSNSFSNYGNTCIKVGIAFQQLAKNDSNAIILTENTYL